MTSLYTAHAIRVRFMDALTRAMVIFELADDTTQDKIFQDIRSKYEPKLAEMIIAAILEKIGAQ